MRAWRRLAAATIAAALLGLPVASAADPAAATCPPLGATALQHEQLTVGATAVALTASKYTQAGRRIVAALITVLTAAINVIDDGTTATASIGTVFQTNERFCLAEGSIGRASFIANTSTSATINVVYYFGP